MIEWTHLKIQVERLREHLTLRQRRILDLFIAGYTQREIAQIIGRDKRVVTREFARIKQMGRKVGGYEVGGYEE